MARPAEKQPKSFLEFVEIVDAYQSKAQESLWFRGCGDHTHSLRPTLYRHKRVSSLKDLSALEQNLMTRFRQRSIPFHSRPLSDDWDVLFFMQHYGIPTRLLDWTENPFVGLYFAVMSARFTTSPSGRIKFTKDAAVWIVNPVKWNQHSLSHQSFDGGVCTSSSEELKGYSPGRDLAKANKYPVCIYGAHNSPRIVAQRGVFTVFGQDTTSMESIYSAAGFPNECLVKVVLKRRYLPAIRKAVLFHGTTESVVFPDLDGLAKELKRDFEFEV